MSTTAYLGDPDLKAAFVAEIEKHRAADRLVQGTYGATTASKGWRGCAVACSLRSLDILAGKKRLKTTYGDHSRFEDELGIPEWLARLEDRIFEGLPMDEAMAWPGRFAAAIPVGADLAPVMHRFGAWLMRGNLERVEALNEIDAAVKAQVLDAIRGVLTLHEKEAEAAEAWSAARSAARSAASAAWSTAESAAWSAASSAWSAESAAWSAESAAWSAESAAWGAAWGAAWDAAWGAAWDAARGAAASAAYHAQAEALLTLLAEATP